MSELAVVNPTELYKHATDIAGICRDIVTSSAVEIKGKKYVPVEAWQAIATAHGCIASIKSVEHIESGYIAVAELKRMTDGAILASAEGFVGTDEDTWNGRAEYANRAMAQTRAISRVCRSAFAHVVVMMKAGLSTTPAEEVPHGGFPESAGTQQPRQQNQPQSSGIEKTRNGLIVRECKVKEGEYTKGEKKGDKWYLYIVDFTDANNTPQGSASTFTKELYDKAIDLGKKGVDCTIKCQPGKKADSWELLEITEEDNLP